MNDIELIQRAKDGCVVGDGRKQIELLIAEIKRIANEVRYVRSQSYCPDMGQFSYGYQTACDEILARIATIQDQFAKPHPYPQQIPAWVKWFDNQPGIDKRNIAVAAIERLIELGSVAFTDERLHWTASGEDLRMPF